MGSHGAGHCPKCQGKSLEALRIDLGPEKDIWLLGGSCTQGSLAPRRQELLLLNQGRGRVGSLLCLSHLASPAIHISTYKPRTREVESDLLKSMGTVPAQLPSIAPRFCTHDRHD